MNAVLGTFTNFVNLLDLAAVAVPGGTRPDGAPVGFTLIGDRLTDLRLLAVAEAANGGTWPAAPVTTPDRAWIELAVVGAHLRGQPLHQQLVDGGAVFVQRTYTAAAYRLFALADTAPPKPALVRAADGVAIEVEVYALPAAAFGRFVDRVPPPLAIGSLDLADGRRVSGFVCEPRALDGATDVTVHGGWRAYLAASRAGVPA